MVPEAIDHKALALASWELKVCDVQARGPRNLVVFSLGVTVK